MEAPGFAGLYRSDHFTNAGPPDLDSLELWLSLTWLADHTRRIQFGQLVSPVSFRHPVFLARMAAQLDDLSGGRMHLGVGAGWQAREHELFGFDLLELPARVDRLAEAVEVITALLRGRGPVTLAGKHYRLREAVLLPRPGHGDAPATAPAARRSPRRLAATAPGARSAPGGPLRQRVERHVPHPEWLPGARCPAGRADRGRRLPPRRRAPLHDTCTHHRCGVTGLVFGRDEAEVARKLSARGRPAGELRQRGLIVGVASEVVDQLGRLGEAGLGHAKRCCSGWTSTTSTGWRPWRLACCRNYDRREITLVAGGQYGRGTGGVRAGVTPPRPEACSSTWRSLRALR